MSLIGRGQGLCLIMGGEDGILCLGVDPVGAGLCVTVSHIYTNPSPKMHRLEFSG